jgi:penicillin-binding protein 1A
VGDVIDYARRLGIESPLERSLALALGSNEVTLLELTRAYAVFPAGGRRVEPTFIRRVLDRDGNVLLENIVIGSEPVVVPPPGEEPAVEAATDPETAPIEIAAVVEEPEIEALGTDLEEAPEEPVDPNQLIPREDAFLMADMLRAVVQEGTGYRLRELGRPLGGKTGTTNDQADGWFVGFSPGLATGVWVGHDSSQKLGVGETGSRAAAPIWVDYMRVALDGRPVRDFEVPASIVYTRIDRKTGLLASATSNETLFQAFITGTEPTTQAAAQQTTDDAMQDLREEAFSGDSSMRLMQLDSF